MLKAKSLDLEVLGPNLEVVGAKPLDLEVWLSETARSRGSTPKPLDLEVGLQRPLDLEVWGPNV